MLVAGKGGEVRDVQEEEEDLTVATRELAWSVKGANDIPQQIIFQ